jgi:predicted DNA-binding transcriptional regulator AlpA
METVMSPITETEPRLIPLVEALKILGIQRNTYWKQPDQFPPAHRNGPNGNVRILNLDCMAFALSLGACRTHREYAKWERVQGRAGR